MTRARKVEEGEWVRPVMTGYLMECCACGRTHRMDFRVTPERGLEMRGWLIDDVAGDTSQRRETVTQALVQRIRHMARV